MYKISKTFFSLAAVLLIGTLSSCAHKSDEERIAELDRKFMGNDNTSVKSSGDSNFWSRHSEQRKMERARFRDVSRPMARDSFRIFPWKESGNRSERLHEENKKGSSIFDF